MPVCSLTFRCTNDCEFLFVCAQAQQEKASRGVALKHDTKWLDMALHYAPSLDNTAATRSSSPPNARSGKIRKDRVKNGVRREERKKSEFLKAKATVSND
jgi:hypothetical protein